MKNLTRMIGIATIVAASSLAHAESLGTKQMETRTKTVTFDRVEAQTSEGAQALYKRLRAAAQSVCTQPYEPMRIPGRDQKACASAALDGAVQKVHLPEVSSLHGLTGTIDVVVTR
jgi:UrcA family protein